MFKCSARNSAGLTEAHYQLTVKMLDTQVEEPRLLQLQLHYFVLVAAGSLVLFVLTSISLSLGCILLCRRRIRRREEKMQHKLRPEDTYPDILSDLENKHQLPSSSSFSLDTATTPVSLSSSCQAVLQPGGHHHLDHCRQEPYQLKEGECHVIICSY